MNLGHVRGSAVQYARHNNKRICGANFMYIFFFTTAKLLLKWRIFTFRGVKVFRLLELRDKLQEFGT